MEELNQLKKSIKMILWSCGGIVRSGNKLEEGVDAMTKIGNQLNELRVSSLRELAKLFDLRCMWKVGTVILESALMREESRGAHYRADFSDLNEIDWRGSIFARDNGTELVFSYVPNSTTTRAGITSVLRYR